MWQDKLEEIKQVSAGMCMRRRPGATLNWTSHPETKCRKSVV